MNKEETVEKIEKFKESEFGRLSIPILYNDKDSVLSFVTKECIDDGLIVSLLSKWRKDNEFWFPAIFPISDEKTKIWLKEKLINQQDRLLFLIKINNSFIGHVGLFRFDWDNDACEIDNILRGESGYPGIMEAAIKGMMQWGRDVLGVQRYYLSTSSDNERALKLYKKIGFSEVFRKPLIWESNKDGGQWINTPAGYNGAVGRYEVKMELRNNYA